VVPRCLGVEFPFLGAGAGVESVDNAPRAGEVHDAILHERRGLESVQRLHVDGPCEAQARDGRIVDLFEGAVALLRVRAAVREPVGGVRVGLAKSRVVHL
jgi:hypothetical protein